MQPPPLDPLANRPDAAAAPTLTPRPPPTPIASSPPEPALSAAAAQADQVLIHPLDLTGALQIMIAEVRAELPLPAVRAPPAVVLPPFEAPHGGGGRLEPLLIATGGLAAESPTVTPQTLVQLFLQALPPPETLEPAAWLALVTQVQGAVQVALDRAVEVAAAWREVPLAVVEGARETRDVVVAAITHDLPSPLWLRPEWLGLAPRMERYRRRRKRALRWLSDPDPHWRERDEDPEREPAADQR